MNKPSTNPTKIAKALAELKRRIIFGNEEFPDAQFMVASANNVNYEALAEAYDEDQAKCAATDYRRQANAVAYSARFPHQIAG